MFPSETLRRLQIGQFWARLNPLTLMQVTSIDPGMYTFREWSPEGEVESSCYLTLELESNNFRYLWFDRTDRILVKLPEGDRRGFAADLEASPGDVWLVQHSRDKEPRLLFIGPATTGSQCHVLADWEVPMKINEHLALAHLFQGGPARRQPGQKSVYEHLRDPVL